MVPLMAKSGEVREETTLVGHTRCVLTAVDALFSDDNGGPSRLGRSWLRFFGLAESEFPRFLKHLRVAAAAHDWGKANDGFQGVVTPTPGISQIVRHEILSALMLADPKAAAWIRDDAGLDDYVILAAIIGHHLKADPEDIALPIPSEGVVRLYRDHADFREIQDIVGRAAETNRPPPICLPPRMKKGEVNDRAGALREFLDADIVDDRAHLLRAVRSALIVSDAAGSSVLRLPREPEGNAEGQLSDWIKGCFSATLSGEKVWEDVTTRRIADLRKGGRWKDHEGHSFNQQGGFTQFQCEVAGMGPRVLLTAACGSGKTLAAWNWIKVQLDERPGELSRVLFLYPTRATATEGFRDYVSWAPEDDAGLLSGTANYELKDMFTVPEMGKDARFQRDYRAESGLFAIGHWKKRVFSATADQFFPFLTFNYGPTCLLPLLAEAVVVVDEVHSFDRSMFATLKRFLAEFPTVPVLCMTATLPVGRKGDLTDIAKLGSGVLTPYPELSPADLKDSSGANRYTVEWIERDAALQLVCDSLDSRMRVLWVSNRVADCQETYETFSDDEDLGLDSQSSHCYHARFTLDDRKVRHRELIRAFQEAVKEDAAPRALLGVTTQVCEMSLDLDTEILITELAPISSLIQRMGRCNRDSSKLAERPLGRVCVLRTPPGKEKPYEKEDLDAATNFVNQIMGRPVSQSELDHVYQECDTSPIEPSKLCPFLDNGPFAKTGESWREGEEFTVPCILDYDVTKVRKILHDRDPTKRVIDGYVVPAPAWVRKEPRPEDPKFPRWLSVVTSKVITSVVRKKNCYDARIGFDDRPFRKSGGRD